LIGSWIITEIEMVYGRVLAAMAVAGLAKLAVSRVFSAEALHEEVHGVASYLEVVAGIYSIVMAFLIFVVWEQWNRVQTGLSKEAAAVEDLCRVVGFHSVREAVSRLRHSAMRYLESTTGDEPGRLAVGKLSVLAEEQFDELCKQVRSVDVKDPKDQAIYDEMLRALTRVSESRDERLAVSATRIPATLWSLVIFGSFAVMGGILFLGIRSLPLSIAASAGAAGVVAFLLAVIRDMDNPFNGLWNVSYGGMQAVAARIAHM
jgi:hypothetical protein